MVNNIKKGIITSIFGVMFLLGAFVYGLYPMFSPDYTVDSIVLIINATIGIGLLLSPDGLFKKLKDRL